MLDAVVGALIMVVATTSMLYSIEVAERAFDQAGRYPLSPSEEALLEDIGMDAAEIDAFFDAHVGDKCLCHDVRCLRDVECGE